MTARSRRAPYTGPRANLKPARSPTAMLQAANDRLAVEMGMSSFIAGQPKDRQRARYLIAAQLVTKGLSELSEASCSATSKGHGLSIVAFGRGQGGSDG